MLEVIIILIAVFWIINKISGSQLVWLGLLLSTSSLIVFALGMTVLAWHFAAQEPEVQEAVRLTPAGLSVKAVSRNETETARQTAIRTHIEILEKELETELETESKLCPGKPSVVEKEETETSSQQPQKEKRLPKEANQELQNKKTRSTPRWLAEYPVIEKKNWQEHLAHPETIPERFIISSGRFATIKEAQSDAHRLAKVTISAKLKSLTGYEALPFDEAWYQSTLSRTYGEELQVNLLGSSPTAMYREHLLVNLSRENVAPLLPGLRKTIAEKRIYTAAGGMVAVMLTSGLLGFVLSRKKRR